MHSSTIAALALASVIAAAMSAPLAAEPSAPAPTVLAPLDPWSVDYGKDRCRAARSFGDKDKPSVLVIDVYGPRTEPTWTIAGPVVDGMDRRTGRTAVRFGDLEPGFAAKQLEYVRLGTFGKALTASGFTTPSQDIVIQSPSRDEASKALEAADFDAAIGPAIGHVDLIAGERVKRLATGSMGEVFKVLANCTDTIVSEWGYDPAVERALTRRAELINTQGFVKSIVDAYPAHAAAIGAQTLVRMRVDVDATGAPGGCVLVEMLDASAFNDYACKVVMRTARFTPALDANGQPVRSYWETQIRYTMETPRTGG